MGKAKKQRRRRQRFESGLHREPLQGSPRFIYDRPVLHLFLITLLGLLCYSNTLDAPFVFDDRNSIVENPVIKDLSEFLSGEGYRFNPRRFIGYLSFALNYHFGALKVIGYHLVNIAIHILSAGLLYALLRLTFQTPFIAGSRLARQSGALALMAATLFVVHPVHTQAVTYIVQRFASLGTMFYLLTVVGYVKARLTQEQGLGPREAGQEVAKISPTLIAVSWYLLALVAAGLAMHTKEIAFTLPFAVVLYEFSFFGRSLRKKLLFLAPVLLTAFIVPLTLIGTHRPVGELLSDVSALTRETDLISRTDYLFTQFSVIVTYLRLLVLPVNQNLDYDYPIYFSLFEPRVFLSFLLLAGMLGMAIYLYLKGRDPTAGTPDAKIKAKDSISGRIPYPGYRLFSFGLLWFFLALSVESSLIPIRDVIFEHRLYLPSIGIFIALAGLIPLWTGKIPPRGLVALALGAVLALGWATVARNEVWGSAISLWQDAAMKSPNKPRPLTNLGLAYRMAGDFDSAIQKYRQSLDMMPESVVTHINLGYVYGLKGLEKSELYHYRRATEIDPGYAEAWENLGAALARNGRLEEGIDALQRSLGLEKNNAEVHFNLGLAFRRIGRPARAEIYYQQALKLDPTHCESLNNLGILYLQSNREGQALDFFQSALDLCPENKGYLRNLAIARQGSSG